MIGFGRQDEKSAELGPYEYRAVRRARFFQLSVRSDDTIMLSMIGFFILGIVFGVLCKT